MNNLSIATVNHDTPEYIIALSSSIRKYVPWYNEPLIVIDNSDSKYWKEGIHKINNGGTINIIYADNNIYNTINKLPKLKYKRQYSSAKHCVTIDWLIKKHVKTDYLLLLDSDIIITKDIKPYFDDFVYNDYSLYGYRRDNYKKKIIAPWCCFINVWKMKHYKLSYFDYNRILYVNNNLDYDTGGSIFEDFTNLGEKIKCISDNTFWLHFKCGSCDKNKGIAWINQNKDIWDINVKPIEKEIRKQPRIVLYTCITSGYDIFDYPLKNKEDNVDYVVFTDDINVNLPGWIVKGIPKEITNLPKKKQARLIKICPHKYLPEYDISIWMDACIRISPTTNLHSLIDQCDLNNHFLYVRDHPDRNCLYDEREVIEQKGIDMVNNHLFQIDRYRNEGFPEHYGLPETNILIRKHNNEQCKKLMDKWASEIIMGSFRDQLSFSYSVWKLNLKNQIGLLNKTCYKDNIKTIISDVFSRKTDDKLFYRPYKKNRHVKKEDYKDGRIMNQQFNCVLGVLTTPNGLEIKKELLEWLQPIFTVSIIEQEPPGTLFEYPAIDFALHKCVETNTPYMYIHTKGATHDKVSRASNVRNIWKDQYTKHFQNYLKAIDITKPMVICPWTGQLRRRTWFNSWIITPPAASVLLKTFHIDENRYYYERLFVDQPDIEIKGILANNCENPTDVHKAVAAYQF